MWQKLANSEFANSIHSAEATRPIYPLDDVHEELILAGRASFPARSRSSGSVDKQCFDARWKRCVSSIHEYPWGALSNLYD
jgi:hypothetical protein